MNQSRILQYLLSAVERMHRATARTRAMVKAAVAAFLARLAIQRAAA